MNQRSTSRTMNCPMKVALIESIELSPYEGALRGAASVRCRYERIRVREEHRKSHTDQACGVDEAHRPEHLGLQDRNQLGLPSARLDELRGHDADADTGAGGAQADDEADRQGGVGLNGGNVHGLRVSSSSRM